MLSYRKLSQSSSQDHLEHRVVSIITIICTATIIMPYLFSEPGTSRSTSSSPFPDCGLGPRTSTPGTSTEQAEVTTKVPAAASSPIPDTEGNGGVHIALPTESKTPAVDSGFLTSCIIGSASSHTCVHTYMCTCPTSIFCLILTERKQPTSMRGRGRGKGRGDKGRGDKGKGKSST